MAKEGCESMLSVSFDDNDDVCENTVNVYISPRARCDTRSI